MKQFELILARLQYGINKRPLTKISKHNKDITYITPSSFLKTPISTTENHQNNVITNHAQYHEESRRICNEYYTQIWTIWLSLYVHDLLLRQKWYKPSTEFKKGDMILYKPPNKFNKEYPLATIIDFMKSSDGVLRHVVIQQENNKKTMTAPVHHITKLEGSND